MPRVCGWENVCLCVGLSRWYVCVSVVSCPCGCGGICVYSCVCGCVVVGVWRFIENGCGEGVLTSLLPLH